MLVAVTDHAVERFRQRVARRGSDLEDDRTEIAARVGRAREAGRVERGERAELRIRDLLDRDLVFVCREDQPRGELVVITLWEPGRVGQPQVPRRFTDALDR